MIDPHDHVAEAAAVREGLEDARGTLAEIWRRHLDDGLRARSMRAIKAVIAAGFALEAADALAAASSPREKREAWEKLRQACCLRVENIRSKQ